MKTTDLFTLRNAYRQQHVDLMSINGDVKHTNRRQRNFRPRGRAYVKLLRTELKW